MNAAAEASRIPAAAISKSSAATAIVSAVLDPGDPHGHPFRLPRQNRR
jgi:hypothetical protein